MIPPTPILNIAHRGASAYAPENTFASFDLALDQGALHAELDVRFTRDGRIVVIHDATVDRTTNGVGPVVSHSLAEIQRLDSGSWFAPKYARERIPSLEQILERYKNRLHLHIEIKSKTTDLPQSCADLVRTRDMVGSVTMTSFHVPHLRSIKRHAPELNLALLTIELNDSIMETAHVLQVIAISPLSAYVTAEWVKRIHREGFSVHVWGVVDEADIRRLVSLEVDGLTNDFPDRLETRLLPLIP